MPRPRSPATAASCSRTRAGDTCSSSTISRRRPRPRSSRMRPSSGDWGCRRDWGGIAYSQAEVDGSWHIWVIPAAGGTARRLSSTPQGEIYPRYMPDGSAILFHNWNEPRRIWQMAPSGGPPTQLAWSQGPDDGYADVAPNGSGCGLGAHRGPDGAGVRGAQRRRKSPSAGPTAPAPCRDGRQYGGWIAFSPSRGFTSGVFVILAGRYRDSPHQRSGRPAGVVAGRDEDRLPVAWRRRQPGCRNGSLRRWSSHAAPRACVSVNRTTRYRSHATER